MIRSESDAPHITRKTVLAVIPAGGVPAVMGKGRQDIRRTGWKRRATLFCRFPFASGKLGGKTYGTDLRPSGRRRKK